MSAQLLKALAAGLSLALACQAQADGAASAAEHCGACHALEAPDFAGLGQSERLERQAPPLFFAGNKYRENWLEAWLQAPETVYPTGYFPHAALISTPEGDQPDPQSVHQHSALDAASAKEVADYLMSLKPYDDLVAAVAYNPGKVAQRMGSMDFRKFKGCNACHQDAPGEGGFSGPVMYNAAARLQAEYLVSFISDPKAWDPNTIMPRIDMNAAAVGKLVDYLRLIGGEE